MEVVVDDKEVKIFKDFLFKNFKINILNTPWNVKLQVRLASEELVSSFGASVVFKRYPINRFKRQILFTMTDLLGRENPYYIRIYIYILKDPFLFFGSQYLLVARLLFFWASAFWVQWK